MAMALRRFRALSARTNWLVYLIVFACYTAGTVAGALAATGLDSDIASDLQSYISSILADSEAGAGNTLQAIWEGVIDNLLVFAAVYILGLTVIGAPVVLGILFIRGFALGFAAWFIYVAEGELGGVVALLSFTPHNILFIPALLVAAAGSLSFTVLLIQRGFNNRIQVWTNFVRYTVLIAATCAVGGLAAVVENGVTPYLIQLAFSIRD